MNLVDELRMLLDESSGGVFWPDAQLHDALNDSQLELLARAKPLNTQASMLIPANTQLVELPYAAVWIPHHLEYGGGQYGSTSQADLERYSPHWRSAEPGTPSHFVLWDATHVRPFPTAKEDVTFTLRGTAWPTEINGVTLDVNLDHHLRRGVVYHAAANLTEHTLPDASDMFLRESEDCVRTYKAHQRSYQPHNILALAPRGNARNSGFIPNTGMWVR